jgi:pimeloyl-ACP methyl ester carboxylesterase
MKKLLFLLALGFTTIGFGQTNTKRTFLFVHGAWGGGWEYARVDSILRTKGDIVFHPTLTGLGERVHLANTEISLSTHIMDIVNVIKFEDLHDVILVGHSYGGMVISGVAEQVPDRIKQLIYLDAFVPNDGESIKSMVGPGWGGVEKAVKDGFVSYLFGITKPIPPTDVPQPLKTFTESIKISNPLVLKIPTAYILMTKDGKGEFEQRGASKARARNWKILTLEGGHYAMRDQPEELVKQLEIIAK